MIFTKDYCHQHLINIGKLWIYKGDEKAPWVLNFPTKFHWKYPSKYEYIEKGLAKFVETYKSHGIKSVAFPLLGTNNGGLDKQVVKDMMVRYLSECNIPVEIYDYDPSVSDDLYESFKSRWLAIPDNKKKSYHKDTYSKAD